jgi:hypothetical protein
VADLVSRVRSGKTLPKQKSTRKEPSNVPCNTAATKARSRPTTYAARGASVAASHSPQMTPREGAHCLGHAHKASDVGPPSRLQYTRGSRSDAS